MNLSQASGMLCSITGSVVTDVSNDRIAFIFMMKQNKNCFTQMMNAIRSFETSESTHTVTLHRIPDVSLQNTTVRSSNLAGSRFLRNVRTDCLIRCKNPEVRCLDGELSFAEGVLEDFQRRTATQFDGFLHGLPSSYLIVE